MVSYPIVDNIETFDVVLNKVRNAQIELEGLLLACNRAWLKKKSWFF